MKSKTNDHVAQFFRNRPLLSYLLVLLAFSTLVGIAWQIIRQ